jgi:hypothetical protein
MAEFRSFPKGEKKPKLSKQQQWYAMQKHSLEKKKLAKKDVDADDKTFFLTNYFIAVKDGVWVCAECNLSLPVFSPDDEALSFMVRSFQHHILPKNKYLKFRHDTRNIIFLCWQYGCDAHSKAESAISYPKLKVFPYCESVKKELLNL